MNKILVISDCKNDLIDLLKAHCKVTINSTADIDFLADYDALCILCGNEPLLPSARLQTLIEKTRAEGKPLFCEQLTSLGMTRSVGTISTDKQRLVYYDKHFAINGVENGDLFNAQSNVCLKYRSVGSCKRAILTFQEYVCAHYNVDLTEEQHTSGVYALWWLEDTTLVSSIKISNFRKANFVPSKKWQKLINSIVNFLAGEEVKMDFAPPVCIFKEATVNKASDTDNAVRHAINWINRANMLKNGGTDGAFEGFSNKINSYSGAQTKATNIRTDCTCEIGGALLFDSIITKNEESKKAAEALFDFAFKFMQVKKGEHKGMLRWSEGAWETCFQDDAARSVLPLLLLQHFGIEVPYLTQITEALDYMVYTTGKNGIRVAATDIPDLTPETIEKLKNGEPGASAHFNSYYHAVLLLAYRLTKKEEYLACAERGLSTLMSVYPNTWRETSETEECCRMLLPLAVLYGTTGKKEHYDWLCRITDDLERFRHPSGGYAEWDTGYKAACSRNHRGECALLANNGDPVADLLYSNNWLPLAFSYAYMITGEDRYHKLWCSHASFILSAQINSEDCTLDGAWTRAHDMNTRETYGMPHDTGWGPHCIESGWTIGEILMGLQFMKAAESGLLQK